LLTLPRSLEETFYRLETGQIQVNLVNTRPNGWIRWRGPRSRKDNGVSPAVYGFLWLLMFVASLSGGIFLLTAAHELMAGWFCFGLAGLTLLRLLLIL
jgi:hypothetical protein